MAERAGGLPMAMRPLVGTCAVEMELGGMEDGPAASDSTSTSEYSGPQRRLVAARSIARGQVW
eukprot:SAG31_NODE_1672_length_7564_cov_10.193704_3_plen_63_part_00